MKVHIFCGLYLAVVLARWDWRAAVAGGSMKACLHRARPTSRSIPRWWIWAEGRLAIRRKRRRRTRRRRKTQERRRHRPKRQSEDRRWRLNSARSSRRAIGSIAGSLGGPSLLRQRLCRSRLGPLDRTRDDALPASRLVSTPPTAASRGFLFLLPGFRHLVRFSCSFTDQVAGVRRQV